nr:phage major capsid protein [Maliibacterium massiliense]
MPVTLSTAEDALKSLYLDVVTDQLNINTNPLYNKIKASSNYVSGKDVKKLARYGLNGGIGAGTEEGALPTPAGNNYATFTATLKNLYGQIEISDKAIQASRDSAGAFVNLLNDELEGLLKASKFNVSRMLYGDGTGVLTACKANTTATNTLEVASVQNLMEGMVVDILSSASAGVPASGGAGRRITAIDRAAKTVTISGAALAPTADNVLVVQGSYNLELTGLGAIFSDSQDIYGLKRSDYSWLVPYTKADTGALSELAIQSAIDALEETADGHVDFIACPAGVRRAYLDMMATTRRNVDMLDLQGGFKAVSYNGIPIYADRFCPAGSMYLLDTAEFTMHQLCDWRWLEDGNGKILRQVAGTPKFTATLVKYAELMCDKPMAQARLTGITEK